MDETPLQKARAKYAAKKRKMINVCFNLETEQHLFQAAKEMPQFSAWVKEQIKIHIKQTTK